MARPLRIEYAGALYHVTARGNEKKDIYFTEADRVEFLKLMGKVSDRFNWIYHAYCQMGNHYHILVETPDGNLSHGMRQLNGVYTQYINRTHQRVGHLFQGRFKAILVQKENYLRELARYIVLNPVRAGMVVEPGDWRWSSYRATVGTEQKPPWLTTDWLLSGFDVDRARACSSYARFVADGIAMSGPWGELKNQIYLGSEHFVEQMQQHIGKDRSLQEVPLKQRRRVAMPLHDYEARYADRDRAMAEAYRSGAYSMPEIGRYFGVGRMTVSRAVKKHENVRWET
jgi:putative transposase